MKTVGKFPTGEPVNELKQEPRTPRRVFVLGVYASAVHARWIDSTGKLRIRALAVASEPEIFWTGKDAQKIIDTVAPPNKDGRLESAGEELNGPSGRALDERILAPLGLTRDDAWLCDLVPHSCMNPGQEKALIREQVPTPNWPRVPECLADKKRRTEILDELTESQAKVLITLGDKPLKYFAADFKAHNRLADYGKDANTYGQLHPLQLPDRCIQLLPIAHPRQIAGLGKHSDHWAAVHETWVTTTRPQLP